MREFEMAGSLTSLAQSPALALYEVPKFASGGNRVFIASTPETRAICNDPRVCGVRYTASLSAACAAALSGLKNCGAFSGKEHSTTVLNILRGGLNFGLRDALAHAFKWNAHSSSFISAQRAMVNEDPTHWVITEGDYKKVYLEPHNDIIFGDVVATGTSLKYALEILARIANEQKARIESLTFFTIGGARSHEILHEITDSYRKISGHEVRGSVVYFEGIFGVADASTPLRIKLDGTDLLRRDGIMAPEFIESQYEQPAYPLERCTIYDAGSRAFQVSEYAADVLDYWTQVQKLADAKIGFSELLRERAPEVDPARFEAIDLARVAAAQCEAMKALVHHTGR
jgi:hypothetical protein